MGNKKTPLIQKLRETGGTLYVFPSASEDVGLNLQSTTTGVAMSHYALLNIPLLSIENCLCESGVTAQNGNEALLMSLQNYMMNFETFLTNRPEYNYQNNATISEKVFWHWAKKIGIIDPSKFSNTKTGNDNIYAETGRDEDQQTTDDTVVKVFGSIDAGNSLSTEFGMYNETYINVPTSYGAGPVYFKTSNDDNFKLNTIYQPDDTTHIEGRGDEFLYYSYTGGQDVPFFDNASNSTYKIDKTFDGIEIVKDIPTIQACARKQFNVDSLIVSSYDDINIDTDNVFNVDTKFEFNAILLYYSIYDQDDLVKTAYATNLFGIIFLDGCRSVSSTDGDSFYIPTKVKTKSTTSSFGDSFSFRVNLKTMSVYDNTDAIIQDNTTTSSISAVEFSDAISNMNKAIDIMNANMHTTAAIQDQYAKILAYYDNQEESLKDLSTNLNAYLKGTHSSLIDTSICYTNVISVNPKSADNVLSIHTVKSVDGASVELNDAAITINTDAVIMPTSDVSILRITKSYVAEDHMSDSDLQVMNEDNVNADNDVQHARSTMDDLFNSYDNVVIKLKQDVDYRTNTGLVHDKVYNQLYIDPESSLFDYSKTENTLAYLKDQHGNIDYVGLIPYLIAQVLKLTQELNDLKQQ